MALVNPYTQGAIRNAYAPDGLFMMTSDRIVYEGRMGNRSLRQLGAYAVYVLVDEPVHVWSNGEWSTQSELALVEPHLPHLVFPSRKIIEILLEVESVSCEAISARWKAMTQPEKQAATSRIHEAINLCQTDQFALEKQSFDMLFFGESVTPRALDPRISEVIDRICLMPEGPSYSVKELAFAVGLSPSRLTHFFSEQIGTTIRRFRAWKRARMAIPIALAERNLLHLALEAGYADSSHFSHSMRSFFGIRARDLCEGLRHVNVFCDPN